MIAVLLAITILPKPTGPYRLGTGVIHMVDPTRPDPVDKKHKRDLMVQLWYPTDQVRGKRAPYLIDKRFDKVLIDRTYYMQDKSLLESWATLQTHALENARVSHQQKWPIILLEPGLGMPRANYTTYCEELASHGYFVAAIDPTRGGLTILPDGRILDAGDDPANNNPAQQNKKVAEWAADMSFVLTKISARSKTYFVDTKNVGAIGHSMGGSAALQVSLTDKRITAVVDLDGSGGIDWPSNGIPKPMLFLKENPNYSDADLAKRGRTRAQWEAMGKSGPKMFPPLKEGVKSKPAFQFSIRDTGHLSFSDAPFLFPNTITRFSGHSLPAERTLHLINSLTLGFFDHCLKGKPWPESSGKTPWPEVEFKRLY